MTAAASRSAANLVRRGIGPAFWQMPSRPPATSFCWPTRPIEATKASSPEFPIPVRAGRTRHHRAARDFPPVRCAGVRSARPRAQPVRSRSRRPAPAHRAVCAERRSRAAVARPGGRAASRRYRAARCARLDGPFLTLGDRAMPLDSRRSEHADGGTDAFFWGLINFRGPALLARPEEPPVPVPTRSSICCMLGGAAAQRRRSRTSIRRSSATRSSSSA